MRLLLFSGIIFMTILTSVVLWTKLAEQIPIVQLPIIPIVQNDPDPVIPATIIEFNKINAEIKTFECLNTDVKVWENGIRLKIHGSVSYEKSVSFRMKIWSILGDETDIGSNEEMFWYWSRRDRNPGLYYAVYEDYPKTRLKTPFNPVFMRESLGLNEIDPKGAKITEDEKNIILTWIKPNATGQRVLYSVFLNKFNNRMQGIAISDLSGKILASCEIEYNGNLPAKIIYDWREEGRFLVLEFQNPSINKVLPKINWDRPHYVPKINMGVD